MKLYQNRGTYNQKRSIKINAWLCFTVAVILLSTIVGCANSSGQTDSAIPSASVSGVYSAPPAPLPSAAAVPSSGAPTGIDPDKFFPAVASYISDLNAENTGIGDLTVTMRVTYIIGFVDITFTDMTSWSNFTDTEKREFIIALGKALDAIAADNIYPGTQSAVGTDTVLLSPGGLELIERTSLGIVKFF